jgi:hypothetical protein
VCIITITTTTTTTVTTGGTIIATIIITMAEWLSSFDTKALSRSKGGFGRPFCMFRDQQAGTDGTSAKKIKESSNLFPGRRDP